MSIKNHKRIFITLSFLVCITLLIHIIYVNISLPKINRELYETGQWVSLDGAFNGYALENGGTKDYQIQVIRIERKTPQEYLTSHGGSAGTDGYPDVKSVLDVELRIKNVGDKQGGMDFFDTNILNEAADDYYIVDFLDNDSLWQKTDTSVNLVYSLAPHSEVTLHIPYVRNTSADEKYLTPILDNSVTFQATKMPVQKFIHVNVTQ